MVWVSLKIIDIYTLIYAIMLLKIFRELYTIIILNYLGFSAKNVFRRITAIVRYNNRLL